MNYEINNNNINNNTMICSNNEVENNFYVFEIKIFSSDDMTIHRKISYNKEGLLLELKNNIKKIKITMCKLNDINNIITIKKKFNNIIVDPLILCSNNLVISIDNKYEHNFDNNFDNIYDNIYINYIII